MQSFLIIQTAFIGDVILATALVEQLKASFPNAEIDFLLKKGLGKILRNNPNLRNIIEFDKSRKVRSLFKTIKTIRKNKYDCVINVHRHGSSGILTTFSGASVKIGFDKNPFATFYTQKIQHLMGTNDPHHEIERNYMLVKGLVKGAKMINPRLYPNQEDFQIVQCDSPFVTLSPASVWYTKMWPKSKWVELARKFPENVVVYLLGGPNDRKLCNEIKESVGTPNILVRAGDYDIIRSAALMRNAMMNYANDSAPIHICTAINAPVTAIFCSTSPIFGYGPESDESHIMEYDGPLPCRPCGNHGKKTCPEGHFKCAQIEVDQVYSTVKSKL
jgi:heptosyltransferase-2